MFILEVNVHISVTATECNRDHTALVMCWQVINSCHKMPESCSTWLLLSSASVTVTDPLGSHVLLNLRPTPLSITCKLSKYIFCVLILPSETKKCIFNFNGPLNFREGIENVLLVILHDQGW